MDQWQAELVKAAGLAVIGFVGGYGGFYLKYRGKLAELDILKKRRHIEGADHSDRIQKAKEVTRMLIEHRQNEISVDDFKQFESLFSEEPTGEKKTDEIVENILKLVPLGLLGTLHAKGVKFPDDLSITVTVEQRDGMYERVWRRGNEEYRQRELRTAEAINQKWSELYGRLEWNRRRLTEELAPNSAIKPADFEIEADRKLEEKYGKENLTLTEDDIKRVNIQLSTLHWVLGAAWDEKPDWTWESHRLLLKWKREGKRLGSIRSNDAATKKDSPPAQG